MRKIRLIIGAIFIINAVSFAQKDSSGKVEFILKIVQRSNEDIIKNFAISESIINHTNDYLYVPIVYPTSVVTVSILNENKWERMDAWGNTKKQGVFDAIVSPVYKKDENMDWYVSMNSGFTEIIKQSDSIRKKYLYLHPEYQKALSYVMYFLKPGETLNDYYLLNEDKLLKGWGNREYKFSVFNDKEYIPDDLPEFPSEILGYKYYDPTKLIANTLYYSIK